MLAATSRFRPERVQVLGSRESEKYLIVRHVTDYAVSQELGDCSGLPTIQEPCLLAMLHPESVKQRKCLRLRFLDIQAPLVLANIVVMVLAFILVLASNG